MIKSVTAINPKGEKITIELTRPELSGLAVTKIEGLGPPKATINSEELAMVDGGLFRSSRINSRTIDIELTMITCDLTPTIEDSRRLVYRYFQIKKPITIQIRTDRLYVEAYGYVESSKPDIFSKLEKTKVSIVCPDPYFYEVGQSRSTFSGVRPMFEFPFSNESTTERLLIVSELLKDTRSILNYDGDVDTGVEIVIHARGPAKNIILYNINTLEKIKINTDRIRQITGTEIKDRDEIIISTLPGKKSARLLRDGIHTNILTVIDRDVDWFKISHGKNVFSFTAEEGQMDLLVTFYYKNAYGGI